MLLDDDVMTDREAQSSPLSGGLGREERIENSLLHVGRNAAAVVANSDLHLVSKIFCRCQKCRFVAVVSGQSFTLCCGVETVGDEVEENARDFLRKNVNVARIWIEGLFQCDVESLPLFRPRAMIGKVKPLLDDSVDVGPPVLARALARMQ